MNIENIRDQFVSEAVSAQNLFADLAKVELYIAESYRARAFIELLQNADDAGAKRFLIRQVGDKLVVANDGRAFTSADIISLCRSGASSKKRGGESIGYRGIGFKSVAGIATEIDVVSGNYAFRFSKTATYEAVNCDEDVPLIRVPHPLSSHELSYCVANDMVMNEGMNSVFILSGLNHRMVVAEARDFDSNSLLFLNCIRVVDIEMSDINRHLRRTKFSSDFGCNIEQIECIGEPESLNWLVSSTNGKCEKIAFLFSEDRIVAADSNHSVIHAFMPTVEFSGAFLKINGDFSTDPSRKSVDMDDLSSATFGRNIDILAGMARTAISEHRLFGFFSPFISATTHEGRFRKLLKTGLAERLSSPPLDIGDCAAPVDEFRLPPDWLPYKDYEVLCQGIPFVSMEVLSSHPELTDFLRWLGARVLTLEESLVLVRTNQISLVGCGQFISRIARQFRFDLSVDRLELVMAAPLLPTIDGFLSPKEYSGQKLLPDFLNYITSSTDADDIRQLFKRLKLSDEIFGKHLSTISRNNTDIAQGAQTTSGPKSTSIFRTVPAIKQWRSAEQNALTWLASLSDVLKVMDVSQANVGYDLEVIRKDGQRYHVEVKSVARFGDPFRLTNNEHATAFQLGKTYLLALVVNGSDSFDIRFIPDPIRTLALEKRCEQWSWYCENYLDQMKDCNDI